MKIYNKERKKLYKVYKTSKQLSRIKIRWRTNYNRIT